MAAPFVPQVPQKFKTKLSNRLVLKISNAKASGYLSQIGSLKLIADHQVVKGLLKNGSKIVLSMN